MKYVFQVEKTKTGFSAFEQNLPIFTTGENMVELRKNMLDALNTWLEYKQEPLATQKNIEVQIDIPQFFEFYKEINAKAISKRIGMNESLLSQYVTGIKKPSLKQRDRILQGIRSLGKELVGIDLN